MKCMPTEEGFVVMIFSESVPKESLVAFLQIEFRSVDGFRTIEVFEPAKWGVWGIGKASDVVFLRGAEK